MMRHTLLVVVVLATLSACSKSEEIADADAAAPAVTPASPAPPGDTALAAMVHNAKVDFAALFVATASEACASVKGQEFPDPKSGSPMTYTAGGVISWGKGSLDYVNAPGAILSLSNSRAEQTFSVGIDMVDPVKGGRSYVAGLSQLNGGLLDATVTDETQALTTGNLCVGKTAPALATQGVWSLAAKYLKVPKTVMSCAPIGQLDFHDVPFEFDGTTISAGKNTFTQGDSSVRELLNINPNTDAPPIVYTVEKSDGSSVSLGVATPGSLGYASLSLDANTHLLCITK